MGEMRGRNEDENACECLNVLVSAKCCRLKTQIRAFLASAELVADEIREITLELE